MSRSIKVLMADDSVAVRRLVKETLSKVDEIEVAGAARDGKEALDMISKLKPDVILLDVEMPILDGIETLRQLRRTDRKTPVLMFSSLTVSGGEATLEALSLGANDYVAKPTAAENVNQAIAYINAELVPKIKQWGRQSIRPAGPAVRIKEPQTDTSAPSREKGTPSPIDVVLIGSSTGGPNALAEVIPKLPANLSVPVLIVQHMPKLFTKLLAERLDKASRLSVKEATDGAVIRAGEVLIAPGDYHMTVESVGPDRRTVLNQSPPENSCRPAVDVLFRSAATVYGKRCLAVMLTGMGKDGLEGSRKLCDRGATLIAQDQASCVVWGMPRAVTEAGIADAVVPLAEIHQRIIRDAKRGNSAGVAVGATS